MVIGVRQTGQPLMSSPVMSTLATPFVCVQFCNVLSCIFSVPVGDIYGCIIIDTSTLNWHTANQLSRTLRELFTNFWKWLKMQKNGNIDGTPRRIFPNLMPMHLSTAGYILKNYEIQKKLPSSLGKSNDTVLWALEILPVKVFSLPLISKKNQDTPPHIWYFWKVLN